LGSATAIEVLYAYAVTGSALATIAILAAQHPDVVVRCLFHGK